MKKPILEILFEISQIDNRSDLDKVFDAYKAQYKKLDRMTAASLVIGQSVSFTHKGKEYSGTISSIKDNGRIQISCTIPHGAKFSCGAEFLNESKTR